MQNTGDLVEDCRPTGHKILVIDDTPLNIKLLANILSAKGYLILTASSGEEGLAVVEREDPDLVLLDVVMPGLSGFVAELLVFIGTFQTYPVLGALAVIGVAVTATYILRLLARG